MKTIDLHKEGAPSTYSMEPRKFVVWLFIISITMLFAAFTSAFLVRRAQGDWNTFDLPNMFVYSTILITLSTVTMQLAYLQAKRDNIKTLQLLMIATVSLGFGFVYTQWLSWGELVNQRIYFTGNPSGTFLYVLTGVHIFHLVTGLIFVLIMLIAAFQYKVHSRKIVKISMCNTYWHFLTVLWIYLFIFLILKH